MPLARRRQRAVQSNLELVHLVQDAQVLQVLRARPPKGQELVENTGFCCCALQETRTETKILAARMGPTVWLEDGPTPIENKSEGRGEVSWLRAIRLEEEGTYRTLR